MWPFANEITTLRDHLNEAYETVVFLADQVEALSVDVEPYPTLGQLGVVSALVGVWRLGEKNISGEVERLQRVLFQMVDRIGTELGVKAQAA